jgi:hypothetical protein
LGREVKKTGFIESAFRWPTPDGQILIAFFISAAFLLTITALAKGLLILQPEAFLAQPDPLLSWLSARQITTLAALLELGVVLLIIGQRDVVIGAALLAWLGLIAVLYRIGLWWVGFEGSCRCLGNIGDVLGISGETADWIAKGIILYLLVGSGVILVQRSRLAGTLAARCATEPAGSVFR